MEGDDVEPVNERNRLWASTMAGHGGRGMTLAHADSHAGTVLEGSRGGLEREEREAIESEQLAPGATRAVGGGNRGQPVEPDPWRTCFERDRDRILHATAFRRLAGKTQVFVFPDDHQRTRLTHALEVAQVATSVARACRLNVALTEAIALGHDCGHGPGGHASEDALSPYLDGGFDHAPWGADVSLAPLNLCHETLDGIRNHSWSRPAPSTPEGEVVSWADRIAYVCHDFEDAVKSGIVTAGALPGLVRERCGDQRSQQLGTLIDALVSSILGTGQIGMAHEQAEALAAFRASNYELIYLRPSSVAQGRSVVEVLRALVDYFGDRPNLIPDGPAGTGDLTGGDPRAVRAAVAYVAGMTDRFAFSQAVALLGWDPDKLPAGIGVTRRL
jgi:dGTPase